MIIIQILLLLVPFIPILLRKSFIVVHAIFIGLFIIILPTMRMDNNTLLDWREITFYFVLAWIFGSLIALFLLIKEDKQENC